LQQTLAYSYHEQVRFRGASAGKYWRGNPSMSRIGKMPVPVPAKVTVTINGNQVAVKGPKGELTRTFHPDMSFVQEGTNIIVSRPSDERNHRELHGLTRALLNNMVVGVTTGFRRTLQIVGVGYRAELKGKDLELFLGYSHTIKVLPPQDVTFVVEGKGDVVHIDGIDKALLGQLAANIRKMRPPEPYLGKGVRYKDEVVRKKAGKAGKGK
jgi:large subunit ribosomal protein L6